MTPFIVCMWTGPVVPETLHRFSQTLIADAWRPQFKSGALWVFGRGDRELDIRPVLDRRGAIIGDLFQHDGADAPDIIEHWDARAGGVAGAASAVAAAYWGRYVVVADGDVAGSVAVFRDPSGALDAFVWPSDGLAVVASAFDLVPSGFQPDLALDWPVIHQHLAGPISMSARVGVLGLHGVSPGEVLTLSERRATRRQIWTPAMIAKEPPLSYEEGRACLRNAVDMCMGAYSRRAGAAVSELSGGLDSSIVTATLLRHGADLRLAMNYATAHGSGDERVYAAAMAAHVGAPLAIKYKRPPDFSPSVVAEVQTGLRPCLVSLDDDYDRSISADCKAAQAQTLFTGQGGDAVFFQAGSPTILMDRVRRLGPTSLLSAEVGRLARWTRRSGWALLLGAVSPDQSSDPMLKTSPWINPVASIDHPWLSDLGGIPAGKRFHIETITQCLMHYGVSRRTRAADVIHPLLSQPILEACLRIPTDLLVRGGRDRALARDTFSDRLPPLIYQRRSKGELGAVYGPSMVCALHEIRPFLLDGRLRDRGLIDRDALAMILTEEHLAQDGGYIQVLWAVAIEAWIRTWEARIARTGSRTHTLSKVRI